VVITDSDLDRDNVAQEIPFLVGSQTLLICPVCLDSCLFETTMNEVPLAACPRCWGVLVSKGSLEEIIRLRRKKHWQSIRDDLVELLQGTNGYDTK
jgi:Zn-finger nucleic acid-binding protein